jgi:hypothetical protein
MFTSPRAWLALTITLLLAKITNAMSIPQQTLGSIGTPISTTERVRPVPGRNMASFTDNGPSDQLFETITLVVSPKVPAVYVFALISLNSLTKPPISSDEPILMYLMGTVPYTIPQSLLSGAVLNTSIKCDTDQRDHPQIIEIPLSEVLWLRIRKRTGPWTEGNVLIPGMVEILADYEFLGIFIETGNYDFEFRVKLPEPDGRVLFGFQQRLYLRRTGWL